MKPIVECVPNISEGRNLGKIDRIANAVNTVPGVRLLDVDRNVDYNRTVITFAGEPDACVEAMFRLTRSALDEIDMTTHSGGHPRSGAVDVAPFIPVRGVTLSQCAELSRKYGKRVGDELGIPVYLYEAAASRPERSNLAKVRKGEYEAIEEKLKLPEWAPDFGPARFVPKSGCVISGARFFLIAYNVNIRTEDLEAVDDMALHVREMGWPMTDKNGDDVLSATGKKVFHPGPLRATKAMGVYLDETKMCQVSINLTNYLVTAPHIAFEYVKQEAAARGLEVEGSEIVGLVPLEAVLLAAEFYRWRDRLPKFTTEQSAVDLAHERLGLSSFRLFDPKTKIIEHAIAN